MMQRAGVAQETIGGVVGFRVVGALWGFPKFRGTILWSL